MEPLSVPSLGEALLAGIFHLASRSGDLLRTPAPKKLIMVMGEAPGASVSDSVNQNVNSSSQEIITSLFVKYFLNKKKGNYAFYFMRYARVMFTETRTVPSLPLGMGVWGSGANVNRYRG